MWGSGLRLKTAMMLISPVECDLQFGIKINHAGALI